MLGGAGTGSTWADASRPASAPTTSVSVGTLRGSGRGDQHVRVKVLTPQKLSSKQKKLLEEFGELCGETVNPEQKSWKDSVKKFFS